jgi:hypothetical protein
MILTSWIDANPKGGGTVDRCRYGSCKTPKAGQVQFMLIAGIVHGTIGRRSG